MTLEEQAEWLNKLPFVNWDRTVRDPDHSDAVFGWIPRDDGRSDFVQMVFWPGGGIWITTSSAEWSAEISRLLVGSDASHTPCLRVEDVYGTLVENRIEL